MNIMPEYLRAINFFADGRGYVGKIESLELPKLTEKTEDYRGGGMIAPVEIGGLGIEKLGCKVVINAYDSDLIEMWGVLTSNHRPYTLRGAIDKGDGTIKPVIVNLTGSWKEVDMGSWKAGDKGSLTLQMACVAYKLTIDGTVVVDIDIATGKEIVGDNDRQADVRAAIGV